MSSFAVALLAAALSFSQAERPKIDWKKFGDAVDLAKKNNRLVAVVATAGWCEFSKKLGSETLAKDDVVKFLNDNFCCVAIDRDKDRDVAEKLGVWPVPQVVIVRPDELIAARVVGFHKSADFESEIRSALQRYNEKIKPTIDKVDAAPENLPALRDLALAYKSLREDFGAKDPCNRILNLLSKKQNLTDEDKRLKGECLFWVGEAYVTIPKSDASIESAVNGLKQIDGFADAAAILEAELLYRKRNVDAAIQALEKIKAGERMDQILVKLGLLYLHVGKTDKGKAALKKLTEKFPNSRWIDAAKKALNAP